MINVWYRMVDFFLPAVSFYGLYVLVPARMFTENEFWFGLVASGLFVFITQLLGGYQKYNKRTIARKLELVLKGWISVILVLVFIAYLLGALESVSRLVFVLWALLVPILVLMSKIFIIQVSMSRIENPYQWVLVGEVYDFNDFEKEFLDIQRVTVHQMCHHDIEALQVYLKNNLVTGVVLNVKEPAHNDLVRLLTRYELAGVNLYSMNHFFEQYLRKLFIPYDIIGVDYLDNVKPLSISQYFFKRSFDISASVILFLMVIPIMIYAVIRIKRESPGPIIFRQERMGAMMFEFIVYKFRSMHPDAEKNGAQFAQKVDPRAYTFGAEMRKKRIDELPQLWNVIKGDLHFVGPRPERKVFTDTLEKEIPFYHTRHLVKPGITGWAQVMYPYGADTEDARQKLMYDLYYIKNWSIWLELETLIRTVGVVLGKKGI